MVKANNTAASTVKTTSKTVKIANVANGAIYTLPTNKQATGASVDTFCDKHAANQLSSVTVQLTELGKSLLAELPVPANGLTGYAAITGYINSLKALNNGMFCTGCGMRIYQLLCFMLGVVPNSSKTSKGKKFEELHHATLGGKDATFALNHLEQVIRHAGGKVLKSDIKNGNTLCMLLSGTNTVGNNKHAFFGRPLVQLTVTPPLKSK
tara:strand:+ start:1643 stop:2269 length:627 start_codon:yes stop_codon:yes gene_type:complete